MKNFQLSEKGQALIDMYKTMVKDGYTRVDHQHVTDAFADFEMRPYRRHIAEIFKACDITTVLDYGCGGSSWKAKGFDEETMQTAIEYFNLAAAYSYEPARDLDERQSADCVISFDVMEHIFISDVPRVLRDIFSYANKLVILNIACYPANATLPNGENAHTTVRYPAWWKGMVDSIAIEHPDTKVFLICSTAWRETKAFAMWRTQDWQNNQNFVINM